MKDECGSKVGEDSGSKMKEECMIKAKKECGSKVKEECGSKVGKVKEKCWKEVGGVVVRYLRKKCIVEHLLSKTIDSFSNTSPIMYSCWADNFSYFTEQIK